MLDQNTDRMWYVIGAVLIGAGIILGANILFPNAFASIGDNMTGLMQTIDVDVSTTIDITPDMLRSVGVTSFEYDEDTMIYDVMTTNHTYAGIVVTESLYDSIEWKPDTTYEVTYRLVSKDDQLQGIQNEVMDASHDLSKSFIYINGERTRLQEYLSIQSGESYDIKLLLHTSDVKPAGTVLIIRPNGGIDDAPTNVLISGLRIREVR